jgi:hypothetical protein
VVQAHADEETAQRLAHLAQSSSLLAAIDHEIRNGPDFKVEALAQTRFAGGLDPPLKDATVNSTVGPYRDADRWVVAQIASRDPASLDAQTRLAVEESICRAWLAQLRSVAQIRWHWL